MLNEEEKNYRSPWSGDVRYPKPFQKNNKSIPKKKGGMKLLFSFIVFFVSAGMFIAALYFFYLPSSTSDVGLEFIKPSRVLVGEPFVFTASFSNLSDNILKNSKLSLFLDDDLSILGQPRSQRVFEKAVGDVGPGSIGREEFNLIATGGSQTVKRITAKLGYSTSRGGGQFESSADVDIVVGEPAVKLDIGGPQSVFNEQNFEIRISYANNSNEDFKNLRLKIDYPPLFIFKHASVEPEDFGKSLWDLGNAQPGSSQTISITGRVAGQQGSFFNFKVSLLADFLGSTYEVDSRELGLAIASTPLYLGIKLNNASDYIARAGNNLTYTIDYRNDSNIVMQDVVIKAQVIGEMFNFLSLDTKGVFDSLTNTISWFGANTPELLNVGPGRSGSVGFNIKLKDSFPIRLISDKDYTIKVRTRIETQSVPGGTTAEKTVSLANLENKVAGALDLEAKAFWRDAASGILNQGPYPPKVNQSTQFTIHWIIRNYSTDVSDVSLSAFLQSGARFTGKVKSNIDTVPVFNSDSGLVTWAVGDIYATKGVVSDPVEAVFQVELVPAITQIGDMPPIIGKTMMRGVDSFTGITLEDVAEELRTNLPYDTTIGGGGRGVQP